MHATALQTKTIGIAAIGVAIPRYAMPLQELAAIRGISADKYIDGLGCQAMAICDHNENAATLAVNAAKRALANWHGSLENIGLVVVATESSLDMSRPLSSWVMEALQFKGQVRSYEVKHACYGGTVAVRQALEWKLSGNSKGKAALVIGTDVALYATGHSGEPTQGAGAIAMIIDQATIASIHTDSYYWSDPQYDFWRPIGQKFPEVNGRLSLACYINAVVQCFAQLAPADKLGAYLQEYKYVCFHVPFPKMVYKAVKKIGEYCGWNTEQTLEWYRRSILPTMEWNQQIGNCYTASLWYTVANALSKTQPGEQICAFSYGSGCGSELLTLQCTHNQAQANWLIELQQDFATREIIDASSYQELRKNYDLII